MAKAYSRLAIVSPLAKLPATRQTNRSPLLLSKAYSGAIREVGAAQDARIGILPADQRLALGLEIMSPRHPFDIPGIALHQPLQRGIRRNVVLRLGWRLAVLGERGWCERETGGGAADGSKKIAPGSRLDRKGFTGTTRQAHRIPPNNFSVHSAGEPDTGQCAMSMFCRTERFSVAVKRGNAWLCSTPRGCESEKLVNRRLSRGWHAPDQPAARHRFFSTIPQPRLRGPRATVIP